MTDLSWLGPVDAAPPPETGQFVELRHSQLLYQKAQGHVQMNVVCDVNEPPASVEVLAKAMVTAIEAYFGQALSPTLIESNKATIVLLLSEMFDSGAPRITEPDILRQLVPQDSFFKWLLPDPSNAPARSAVDAAASGSGGSGPQARLHEQAMADERVPWDLPWRRARVKHSKQELYVDVIERVNVLVRSKSGARRRVYSSHIIPTLPARVQVSGRVVIMSKLNGAQPTVTIDVDGGGGVGATRLHQCVSRAKWLDSAGQTLSFVPPDGETEVAVYKCVVNAQGPVLAEIRRGVGDSAQTEVRLATLIDAKVAGVTNLVATLVYPPETKTVKEVSSTGGDLDVSDPRRCKLRFEKSVPMGWQATLRTLAVAENDEPVEPVYVELEYSLVGRVPTQTRVRGIHIAASPTDGAPTSGNEARPFKGVRYQTIAESYIVK